MNLNALNQTIDDVTLSTGFDLLFLFKVLNTLDDHLGKLGVLFECNFNFLRFLGLFHLLLSLHLLFALTIALHLEKVIGGLRLQLSYLLVNGGLTLHFVNLLLIESLLFKLNIIFLNSNIGILK